ncbi:alpha/beta hydrolase [Streptacidiphilus sp. PB12-B1b]|uniref:alpha/beta hydrolase n=1 Tax=Streptacidiphilus sp. PB12-B1b TaxID=2705012 RepID=UPI0015FD0236|nr:alpha/beta fold hydrolase [Streptacidiphilus sp. PB12-B1b]QMU79630.1 alpha/beta hydrolase [Streptacidiphilus sp. PB12-B1b]
MDPRAKSLTRNEGGVRPWSAPAEALLSTADGVRLHAAYSPPRTPGAEVAVVLAHGFSGAVERPAVRRAAALLTGYAGVVTFSFRGHGRSAGLSTVGDREVLDVQAAVAWARSLGYRRVVTLGFSMGGAVVLRHAALHQGVDAVAAVSAPARWYYRGTVPMRRLHWVVMRPLGRVVGRVGLRTRIDPQEWPQPPLPPVAAAALLPALGIPLLVVHGDTDPYFPLDHPRSLYEAAGPDHAELWIEAGFGHAENSAPDALIERVGEWLAGAR